MGSHPDTIRMIVGNKLDLVQPSPLDDSMGLPPSQFSLLGEDTDDGGQSTDGGAGAGNGSSGHGDGCGGSPTSPMRPAVAERQVSAEEAAAFAREHGWVLRTGFGTGHESRIT